MKLLRGADVTQFSEDLKLIFEMSEQKKAGLIRWFEGVPNLYPASSSELLPLATELKVDAQDLLHVIEVLRFVLVQWSRLELSEEDLLSDFVEAKLDQHDSGTLLEFFRALGSSREKVRRESLKRGYEQVALPTIDDVNVLWDIRPMFEEAAYTINPKGSEYEKLVGKTYVLLLEISASRTDGFRESKTFQLSEEEFDRLVFALQRARRQLEVVKQKVI